VATTSMPLLPLVEQGSFSGALYYALNVVYLEVSEL
jgi:transcriptional regulator of acetoin/glycerol metabolism